MKAHRILAACAAAGVIALLAGSDPSPVAGLPRLEHQKQMTDAELKLRFEQAVVMLHAKQYEHAVAALHRVLQLAPALPEAHVNMGYALVGLNQADAAMGFFQAAIDLRPTLANAYYGLALAAEQKADYETALGGMRSFLHLTQGEDAHGRKARAAIWEWEEKLGRHKH